jgi:TonB family protein
MKCTLHLKVAALLFGSVFLFAQDKPASTELKPGPRATSRDQKPFGEEKDNPPTLQEIQAMVAKPGKAELLTEEGQVEILSDTMGVDFCPYLQDVLKTVKQNRHRLIPESERPPLMKEGKVSINFTVLKDGRVTGMQYVSSSGDVTLDQAAYAAITASNPFSPLPAAFDGQSVALRFHFRYKPSISISPGDFGKRYPWYLHVVQQKVAQNWLTPEADPRITEAQRVYVTFDIQRDGRPTNVQLEQSSCVPALDQSAIQAIQNIAIFGPLPAGYSGNKVSVEFWFDYKK